MADQGESMENEGAPLLDGVREAADAVVGEQKARAAELVKGLARTLRRTARTLDEHQIGVAARYADRAAGEVDRWGDAVGSRSLGSLAADVEALARREPEWFIAGAAVAGFLLGRMLRGPDRRKPHNAD